MSPFWKGVLLGAVAGTVLAGAAVSVYAVLHQAREGSREVSCGSGLAGARQPFAFYRDANNGAFPERLEDLDLSRASPDALRCPKAQHLDRQAYLYIPPERAAPEDAPVLLCWRHPRLLILTKAGDLKKIAR